MQSSKNPVFAVFTRVVDVWDSRCECVCVSDFEYIAWSVHLFTSSVEDIYVIFFRYSRRIDIIDIVLKFHKRNMIY